MKRQVLTDLFTTQQMCKNRPEGGEWGNGGFEVSRVHVIFPPSIVLLLSVHVCLLSNSSGLTLWDPMDCNLQDPLSYFCSLEWNAQEVQFSNLTLSVVSWQHRMWFYVWNSVQYGHWRGILAPRDMHGTWWMVCEWMRSAKGLLGDQQCDSPGPPLHAHKETSYLLVSAPPLTLTPLTSEDRYDTGKLPATIVAASLLKHTSSFLALVQKDVELGKSSTICSTNADILGSNRVKGVG